MTVTATNIVPSKTAENVQTTQYTSSGLRTVIDKFTATNYSTSKVTISVNLITGGFLSGNDNLISKSVNLLPNETYNFPEIVGHVLEAGGFISTVAGAANAVSIRASGRKITL